MKIKDDKDKPTALEIAIKRAYDKRDISKFVKLIGKMMTLSDNKDGAGGAKMFQYALAQIQNKKDDNVEAHYNKEMAALLIKKEKDNG